MNRTSRLMLAIIASAGLASVAMAQPGHDQPKAPGKPAAGEKPAMPAKPQGQPTMEDMEKLQKAYMDASKPGKMHEHLTKGAGTWVGKVKSYEVPGQPPEESACTTVNTVILGGRFLKNETSGEMGKMGHFEGFGLYGYDTATQKFQQTWADNMGTGMMSGTGELSADGKTLTWNLTYNDPVTKQPGKFREVEHYTGDNTMTLEMFGPDPVSGKEMKMMEIDFTRKGGADMPTKPGASAKPQR